MEKVENGYVCTIEGNTSSAYGVVANGGGVSRKRYPLSYGQIGGYGRPDWSLAEGMTEEDENMTLDKFKELMKEYRAELQDNDCGAWSRDAREWAIASGLINGTGTTATGEPNYACYLNMCKSDHSEGGITFESAKAKGFVEDPGWESPAI